METRNTVLLIGGFGLWLALVAAGLWQVNLFEATPGAVAARPVVWPERSTISRAADVPTLILVAHPECPCTRASLTDLARLLASRPGPVRTTVLFVLPRGMAARPEQSPSWAMAAAIPGVTVRRDPDGIEAARLGAETSGQCFLFAADGRRLFAGGITEGRGHEGDSRGSAALAALIAKKPEPVTQTPVFGCPLRTASKVGGNAF